MFKSSIGFEAELFLINSQGEIKPYADEVLELTKNLKRRPVKEYAMEVIEMNAHPSEIIEGAILDYVKAFYEIDEIIAKKDLYLLPIAMYPLDYQTITRKERYYLFRDKVFEREKRDMAARATSFHFHYTIPNDEKKVVDLYNFLISFIPVFDILFQSSPFFKSINYGKSIRGLTYRDFPLEMYPTLKDLPSVHRGYEEFGGIPEYVGNFYELLRRIHKRNKKWKSLIFEKNFTPEEVNYDPRRDYYWGAVRLNPIGTIELRSPDINQPSLLLDGIYLFRKACDFIVNTNVIIGEELFFDEGSLHIPPYEKIRELSFNACKEGLGNDNVFKYVKKYLNIIGLDNRLTNINRIIEEKKTYADVLLEKAGKLGYDGGLLGDEQGKELSLWVAENMLRETNEVEKKALSLFSDEKIKEIDNNSLISKILEYIGDEKKNFDLSRASPSRLRNISSIVISPYVLEIIKNTRLFKENLLHLKKSFNVLLLVKKEDSHLFSDFEGSIDVIEVSDLDESIKAIKGAIKVWADSKNLNRNNILYLGIKRDEKDLMNYFGASATYLTNKEVKEEADVLIKDLRELKDFVGNH